MRDVEKANEFLQSIENEYNNNEFERIFVPKIGQICCGLTVANNWQRCRILDLHLNETCTVHLFDIGKKERISWKNLRILLPEKSTTRPLAICCTLSEHQSGQPIERITSHQLKKFQEIVEHSSQFMMFVCRPDASLNGIYLYHTVANVHTCINNIFSVSSSVPLTSSGISGQVLGAVGALRLNAMVQSIDSVEPLAKKDSGETEKVAPEPTESSKVVTESPKPVEMATLTARGKVILQHFDSIDSLYICPDKDFNIFEKMDDEIQDYADSNFFSDNSDAMIEWEMNDYCLVAEIKNRLKHWYRGKIISVNMEVGDCDVFCRDIGKIISTNMKTLRPIDLSWNQMNNLIKKCRLSCITANRDTTPTTLKETIDEMIHKYDGLAASGYGNQSQNEIILWGVKKYTEAFFERFEYVNINKKLVDLGLATATTSFEDVTIAFAEQEKRKCHCQAKIESDMENGYNNNNGASNYKLSCKIESVKEWLPSESIHRSQFTAYPVYVNRKFDIIVLDEHRKNLTEEMKKILRKRYKSQKLQLLDPYDLTVGTPCFAPYEKNLYRATIHDVIGDTAVVSFDFLFEILYTIFNFSFLISFMTQIRFVDFGNIEKCHTKNLRKADMFGGLPILARKYRLHNISFIRYGDISLKTIHDFISDEILELPCTIEIIDCICRPAPSGMQKSEEPIEKCKIYYSNDEKDLRSEILSRKFANPLN